MTSLPRGRSAQAAGATIRRARLQRRWTQLRLAYEHYRVARTYGLKPPDVGSLRSMISRWEKGHRDPDEINRRVLCEALGIPLADLRLPIDTDIPWPP